MTAAPAPPPGVEAAPARHLDPGRHEVARWRHGDLKVVLHEAGTYTYLRASGRGVDERWLPRVVDLHGPIPAEAWRGIADPAELAAYRRLLAAAQRWLAAGPAGPNEPATAPVDDGQLTLDHLLEGATT